MRPKGTPEQLAARRAEALRLLAKGRTPTEVARSVGVVRQTIYVWKTQAKLRRGRHSRRPGGVCRVTPQQQTKLGQALLKGAYAHGYPDDHWTLDRIGRVIFDLYQVRYHPSSVWHLLRRMNWSVQKPKRVAVERDEQVIAQWKTNDWRRIKKVARPERDADSAG